MGDKNIIIITNDDVFTITIVEVMNRFYKLKII